MRRVLTLGAGIAILGCAHRPPSINGVPGAPTAPNEYWIPSPSDTARLQKSAPTPVTPMMPASASRLSVPAVVDLALRNNPTTRLSWAQARSAADVFGASRGSFFPSLTLDVTAVQSRPLAPSGVLSQRTQYGPVVGLSYLVLDFGARAGNIDIARQTAIAADLSHNVAVQNTILSVEQALFNYQAARTQ